MIAYRVQASTGETWATHWETNAAAARKTARGMIAAGMVDVHVDRVDVPTGREGIVEALNHADANRINWDGEELKL